MTHFAMKMAAFGAVLLTWPAAVCADAVTELMSVMPGEKGVALVVVNPVEMDKTLMAIQQRFDKDSSPDSILEDLKKEFPFSDDVDFSKPIGLAVPVTEGAWREPVVWLHVPKGASVFKSLERATQQDGIWTLPSKDKPAWKEPPAGEPPSGQPPARLPSPGFVAKVSGPWVMLSESRESIDAVSSVKKPLGAVIKRRSPVIAGRHVFAYLDMVSMRPSMKAGVAQGKQMAPMLAMLAAQGGDPSQFATFATVLLGAADRFVDQIGPVVVSARLTPDAARVTISAAFEAGPIRDYLNAQKPPRRKYFAEVNEQPYFCAVGFEMPGEESPFFEYLLSEMGKGQTSAEDGKALMDSFEASLDFYRLLEGGDAVLAFVDSAMAVSGNYFGADATKLMGALRSSMKHAAVMTDVFSPGMSYEEIGAQEYGDVEAVEFAFNFDTESPQAEAVSALYGQDVRFAAGVKEGKVVYCVGSQGFRESFFTGKVAKPLAANTHVTGALAALPAEPNAVVLIDPAGMLPMVGIMTPMPGGGADIAKLPPGPPIALSLSLSGDPARLDIHVPFKAIERVVTAMEGNAPM